jgi:hypothetical protein
MVAVMEEFFCVWVKAVACAEDDKDEEASEDASHDYRADATGKGGGGCRGAEDTTEAPNTVEKRDGAMTETLFDEDTLGVHGDVHGSARESKEEERDCHDPRGRCGDRTGESERHETAADEGNLFAANA